MRKSLGANADILYQDEKESVRTIATQPNTEVVRLIDLERVVPDPLQPRKNFDLRGLEELAQSILEIGVIQPLIVRPHPVHGFELIAGERRYRASKIAGLKSVPVIVRDWTDSESNIAALVENLQREDLDPLERAEAFSYLISTHNWKQQDLANKLGLSRSKIANTIRLLKLDDFVQASLQQKKISEGHAKVLGSLSIELQKKLAHQCIAKGWSVRQLELHIEKDNQKNRLSHQEETFSERDFFFSKLENLIEEIVLTSVQIKETKKGQGSIIFNYHSDDHFIDLLNRLSLKDVLKTL